MSDSDYKKLESFFNKYKKAYNDFSFIDLEEYELGTLGPEVWQRLDYINQTFIELLELCQHPKVEIDLNERLKAVLPAYIFNLQTPEPQLAKDYLVQARKMISEQYLAPIKALKEKHKDVLRNNESRPFISFLNEARFLFDSIVQTTDKPFTMHYKAMPSVKNLKTMEVLAKEPDEFSFVLLPFVTRLNEIATVCGATSNSIDHWAKQRQSMKINFLSYVKDMANVESTKSQEKNSYYLNIFQVLVIVFTVCLIVITDRVNLYIEKKSLEAINSKQTLEMASLSISESSKSLSLKTKEDELAKVYESIKVKDVEIAELKKKLNIKLTTGKK